MGFQQLVDNSELAKRLRARAGLVAICVRGEEREVVTMGTGVDERTPMEIGSATKGFTGLLLAESLLRGEIQVDSRVDEVLFGERWDGAPAITVQELATHTAGLPKLSFAAQRGLLGDPYRNIGRDHVLRWLQRKKPRSTDSKVFGYSNFGMAVLGLMLERATGQSYEELLQERLLTPMKLQATHVQTRAGGTLVSGGTNMFGRRARPWHFDAYAPCGGMVSTADDLSRAVGAFVMPQSGLAEAVELACTPHAAVPGGNIGFAWMMPNGGAWQWHNGATYGYASYVGFSRQRKCGMVLLTNQYSARDPLVLGHAIMRELVASA